MFDVPKFWSHYNEKQGDTNECNTIQLNQCFANRNAEDKIYPLTVKRDSRGSEGRQHSKTIL